VVSLSYCEAHHLSTEPGSPQPQSLQLQIGTSHNWYFHSPWR